LFIWVEIIKGRKNKKGLFWGIFSPGKQKKEK
jgi:hypothetical protein